MNKLVLSKEVEINGEKVNEIEYDFENLTGEAIENAMKTMQKTGYIPAVQEVDPILHAHIFADAAGLDYLDIKKLPMKDYLKVSGEVRNFFFADLVASQQQNI